MKFILPVLLTAFSALPAAAQASSSLRDHMRAMGYLLDDINSRADQIPDYHTAAAKTRELRDHLIQSLPMDPAKFANLNEREKNAARLEYHQLFARVIYLSATLEKTFDSADDFQAQSGSRRDDVRNLLHEINVLVGKAHGRFRD